MNKGKYNTSLLAFFFFSVLSTAWSDVTLKASSATRDKVWKTESWSKGAYVIHDGATLYKIVTAKMSWTSPASGKFGLKLKVFAKSNGPADIWVKVNGKEIWKGKTPLPYGLSRPYCCGSKNKRDCALNKGVGELATVDAKISTSLSKGDVVEFYGKTAYHCQPSGWSSGESTTGYGGGTYAGIVELQFTGAGSGGTTAIQPMNSGHNPIFFPASSREEWYSRDPDGRERTPSNADALLNR